MISARTARIPYAFSSGHWDNDVPPFSGFCNGVHVGVGSLGVGDLGLMRFRV